MKLPGTNPKKKVPASTGARDRGARDNLHRKKTKSVLRRSSGLILQPCTVVQIGCASCFDKARMSRSDTL